MKSNFNVENWEIRIFCVVFNYVKEIIYKKKIIELVLTW